MATVTKIKAELVNDSLPILSSDGTITNYYYGSYVNKMKDLGYVMSATEKQALDRFVKSGLDSWINDVYYFLPFIGNSGSPNAGVVPLIDNLDNYRMAEYDLSTESYSNFFEFSDNKIISLHNTQNIGGYPKTPLLYSKDKGYVAITYSKFNSVSSGTGNYFGSTDIVLNQGVNTYLNYRYQYYNSRYMIQAVHTSSINTDFSQLRQPLEYCVTENTSGLYYFGLYHDSNDALRSKYGYYDIDGENYFHDSAVISLEIEDLDYGKINYGRNMKDVNCKCLGFINPAISEDMVNKLASDIKTLMTALGR